MENKVRVLYFVDRLLRGGIQTFVLENIKHMDRTAIQIDFLLLDDGKQYELESELQKLGCNIYKLDGIWLRKPMDFVKYTKAVEQFFKEHHDYKVVHLHSSSKNYIEIPYEELEFCVGIIVVDAFIRCKIFKNPEGYNYVVTR